MQQRLEAAGIRPISRIVDATNYVMLDLCQPNHAYDLRFIDPQQGMGVRFASSGETFETLDAKTHELSENDLVITNGSQAVGIAGVMGGKSSEVRSDTSEVWVESAVFDPAHVRKTAKRHAIKTEASHRFERGVDLQGVARAGQAVADLIVSMHKDAGDRLPEILGQADDYAKKIEAQFVALRPSRVQQILGVSLTDQEIKSYMESLEFRVSDSAGDRLLFEVPSHRQDIEREADLIEEVGRMHGFDKISPELPRMSIEPDPGGFLEDLVYQVKSVWAAKGYNEMVSYSFISQKFAEDLALSADHPLQKTLKLKNPLSDALAVMRPSLAFSLIEAIGKNNRSGTPYCQFFECGRVFHPPTTTASATQFPYLGSALSNYRPIFLRSHATSESRPIERLVCGGIATSPKKPSLRHTQNANKNVYTLLKRDVRNFLSGLGCSQVSFEAEGDSQALPYLYPGQVEFLRLGSRVCGYIGRVHPEQLEKSGHGDKWNAVMFELDLGMLTEALESFRRAPFNPARFPSSARDFTAVVAKTVQHQDIAEQVRGLNIASLERFELIDIYEGPQLEGAKKSMSYRFYFRNPQRTLKDKEVDTDFAVISAHLDRVLGS